MARINSKQEMYEKYLAGEFGNRVRTWATYHDYLNETRFDASLKLSVRYRGQNPGRWSAYGLSDDEVYSTIASWHAEGADVGLITLNESAPDDQLLLQGEVMRSERHYELMYSTTPGLRMNDIRKDPSYAWGLKAISLLRTMLCPSSYEDLQTLFDKYPDSVVEFSAYRINLGDRPQRNTVFWEVRNY